MHATNSKLVVFFMLIFVLVVTPASKALSSSPYITAGMALDPTGHHVIWTPNRVFQQHYASYTATEVTAGGDSISDVRGVVCDPSGYHLIWTPTGVFQQHYASYTTTEITADGGSITNVRGIVSDPAGYHLIWTPTAVFQQHYASYTASEITAGGGSITNVRGIVSDPAGYHLIWTPTAVFQQHYASYTASEITAGGGSITNVRGIVSDPAGYHLVWTPTGVFQQYHTSYTATEITADGGSIVDVRGIVSAPGSYHVIWTPTSVFQQHHTSYTATEITADGGSITNVRGIVCDPGGYHLVWTPTSLFQQNYSSYTATEITAGGGSIADIEGIVCDNTGYHLIWTPTAVFQQNHSSSIANEITGGGGSIVDVRGIISDRLGYHLVWTPTAVFQQHSSSYTATEITAGGGSIVDVWGIVYDLADYHVIWTPTAVFQQHSSSYTATEITAGGSSIVSFDPDQVHTVHSFVNSAGVITEDPEKDIWPISSGAGVVGGPAFTPVEYTGISTAAVVVPYSNSLVLHSTVIGAGFFISGPYIDNSHMSLMILGPEPEPGVVSGNSMQVYVSVLSGSCSKEGDPGFYFDFPGGTISVIRGESWCEHLYAANMYWASATCTGLVDTFCVTTGDDLGWPVTNSVPGCQILDDNLGVWYYELDICITVPCEAVVGETNTLTVQMSYCDINGVCAPDCGDCEDPNWRSDGTIACFSTITQGFEVVASPPALYILQDTLYIIEQGQTAAYVPFSICNGDACAPPTDYDYLITSLGNVGSALNQGGTASSVVGGECSDVYGIVDAGTALVCTWDTLTIIVWDAATGTVYDTCVQAIHVVEPIPVPIFSAPVVTILVLAMIAAAAIMKHYVTSRA